MMLRTFVVALLLGTAPTATAAAVGQSAPDFNLADTNGNSVHLSDFKGRYVVLEWTNPNCPFVRNHYNTKNMQGLQQRWGERDVVWFSIDSTSRQSWDYVKPIRLAAWMQNQAAAQKAVLVDPDTGAARAYQAKTTPHMFVIDPQGTIIYAGAIDDRPSTRPEDPLAARNYVQAALSQATDGKPVTTPSSVPYGCSIKY